MNEFIIRMKELEQKPLEFVDVDNFIHNHKHIYYCEAIISIDGRIAYCIPSHINALIKYSGKSRDEIDEMMPVDESPLEWLVKYTGAVAVWYNYKIIPDNCTEAQIKTLNMLKESNIIL